MASLVEGFSPDAVAVARLLAGEGVAVVLAGPGSATPEARALRAAGVEVAEHADLDGAAPAVRVAYLDAWTPEVAPRVGRLRAAGTRISSIGDLVLERSAAPVVGITGTAGKTTTTGLVAHLLAAAGVPVLASDASASGNRWPDAALLAGAPGLDPGGRLVVELTSSHLAFMTTSPAVAVVTTFWPDHLELHGSLAAYRAAKETIVRHQRPGDHVVVDLADPEVERFAQATPAERHGFAPARAEGATAWIEGDQVVIAASGSELRAPLPPAAAFRDARAVNVAAACAAAVAAGARPEAVVAALADAPPPPFRLRDLGLVGGVRVVDDGMAATPAKARATLAGLGDRSAVLVCGGDHRPAWGAVHASPPEQEALVRACAEVARVARRVVAFGPAAALLEELLVGRSVPVEVVGTLDEAVVAALEPVPGTELVVFSPMFPVPDRARFPALVTAAAR